MTFRSLGIPSSPIIDVKTRQRQKKRRSSSVNWNTTTVRRVLLRLSIFSHLLLCLHRHHVTVNAFVVTSPLLVVRRVEQRTIISKNNNNNNNNNNIIKKKNTNKNQRFDYGFHDVSMMMTRQQQQQQQLSSSSDTSPLQTKKKVSPSSSFSSNLSFLFQPSSSSTLSTTSSSSSSTSLQNPEQLKQTIDKLLLRLLQSNHQQQPTKENSPSDATDSSSPAPPVTMAVLPLVSDDDNRLSQRTCDTLMGLCVAWEEWEYVIKVLELMDHHGLQQQHSTYRASLKTCWEVGNSNAAMDIIKAMEQAQVSPKPTDVGLLVSTLCKSPNNDDNNYNNNNNNNNNNKSKRRIQTQWRHGWRILKSVATVPSRTIESKDHHDAASQLLATRIIPIKAYQDVLTGMKKERLWKDTVRLLRFMEHGTKSTKEDTSTIHQVDSQSVPSSTMTTTTTTTTTSDMYDFSNRSYGFLIPSPTMSIYQTVIECCIDNQQLDAAVQILQDMTTKQNNSIIPKPALFQAVLAALAKKQQWRKALQVLDRMVELNVPRSVVTYNTVISACAKAREVGMAKNLLSRMKQRDDIRPDEISFNAVIGACANTARWKEALEVLDQCYREPGVTPNIYIYTNAMRACARGGKTQRALSLLQVVKDKGLPLDSYCYTAVIDACAKGGMWEKALSLFDEMEEKGIEPTEVTYSVTISALGTGLQWERALWLLNLMQEKGMSVNLITYNAAITALAKSARKNSKDYAKLGITKLEKVELWRKALELLDQMKASGVEPDGFCYSSAISCCGAEGRWEEACDLIEVMKKGGPKTRPNKIAYTAAIGACGRAGQASKAFELFETMKSEGLAADRVAFNSLFSALRLAQDPDKTYNLWKEMCQASRRILSRQPKVQDPNRRVNTTPDIITISDCIATLSDAGRLVQMDEVFEEAVSQGIVLRNNALDGQWEVDLSGMTFPVARAACRFLLKNLPTKVSKSEDVHDMIFITGIGRAQQLRKEDLVIKNDGAPVGSVLDKKDPITSLRDFVQGILKTDFEPPLASSIPERAQGTVVVEKETLAYWLSEQ